MKILVSGHDIQPRTCEPGDIYHIPTTYNIDASGEQIEVEYYSKLITIPQIVCRFALIEHSDGHQEWVIGHWDLVDKLLEMGFEL